MNKHEDRMTAITRSLLTKHASRLDINGARKDLITISNLKLELETALDQALAKNDWHVLRDIQAAIKVIDHAQDYITRIIHIAEKAA